MTCICVLAVNVLLIKMACAVNWIIVRESRTANLTLSSWELDPEA